MSRLITDIKNQNYTDRILTERQISRVLGGSRDRRYGQVKRAMQSGDLETALAFHGWIPEAVYETISVTPGRKKHAVQHSKFRTYSYFPLALNPYEFLQNVKRHNMGGHHVLIAEPLRALMDLVTYRKQSWSTLDWVENGLRIERDSLINLKQADFKALRMTYKHKRAQNFLIGLQNTVLTLKTNRR